jgi:hypothetical protein
MQQLPQQNDSFQKLNFQGKIISVQPRIRLMRSFDERSHTYLGYALRIDGEIGGEQKVFKVGIGNAAQAKFTFQVGNVISGQCQAIENQQLETIEYYRASKLEFLHHLLEPIKNPPPWIDNPPELNVYRQRGHRRLDVKMYESECISCKWGCHMAVEIIVDHWRPDIKKYRTETFCYGPKSCPLYKAGPTRKVPGRKGMVWEEEDWVDQEATYDRGEDE